MLVLLVKLLIWISCWLPRKWLHVMFSGLALIAFVIIRKEQGKTVKNLRIAHPEWSDKQARKFARRVYVNLGKNYADIAKNLSIKTKEQFRKVINIEGEQHFIRAFERGQGVLALSCHRGAFELAGTYCGLHYPTVGVGAKLKNETLDRLVVENRTSRGMHFSHRGRDTLKMLRALKQGKVVLILIDQDISKVKHVFVNFYGKKAATPIGATLLALKTGAAVVPIAMSMQKGKQVLTIRPEVKLIHTGNKEQDIQVNTQRISGASEAFIREFPEQWVWMHERWKTKPQDRKGLI